LFCKRPVRCHALALALAGLVAVALGVRVPAQDSQYWDIQYDPVGQLLGGQVVGSTRDLSATYYNPGGLALGEDPDFLLSVPAFQKQTLTSTPVAGGAFLDVSAREWGRSPASPPWPSPRAGSARRRVSRSPHQPNTKQPVGEKPAGAEGALPLEARPQRARGSLPLERVRTGPLERGARTPSSRGGACGP
jgi:hypothetical protein